MVVIVLVRAQEASGGGAAGVDRRAQSRNLPRHWRFVQSERVFPGLQLSQR